MASVSAIAQPKPSIDRSKQNKQKTETTVSPPSGAVTHRNKNSTAKPVPTCHIAISPDSAYFGADGGTKTFVVSSSQDWDIYITKSWGSLSRFGDTVILSVDVNSGKERNASFFVKTCGDKIIEVPFFQSQGDYLNVSDEDLLFPAYGGERFIHVETSQSWEISYYPEKWGHLQINGDNITLKVDSNNRPYRRTDFFSILSGNNWKKINITQEGIEYYIKVDGTIYPQTVTFDPSGGSKYYSVSTNAEDYTISELPDWCRVESKTRHGFSLACLKNNTASQRHGHFYVEAAGKSVRVDISQIQNKKKAKLAERFPQKSEWQNILGFNIGVIGHYHSPAAVWQ